jgi:hypothetical protein
VQLLGNIHAATRRLFSVPQRGIEYVNSVAHPRFTNKAIMAARSSIWQIYNISGVY